MRSVTFLFLLTLCFLPLITCAETEPQDVIALESGTSVDTHERMESYMNTDADAEMDIDSELDHEHDLSSQQQEQLESEEDSSISLSHSIRSDADESIDAMLENANDALLEMNSASETNIDEHMMLHTELDTDNEAEIDSEQETDAETDTDVDVAADAETDAEMTMETDIEHEMQAFLESESDSEATMDAELEVKTETGVDTDVDVEYYNSTHRCNGRTLRIPRLAWGRALFMNGRYVGRLPGGVTPLWIPLRGRELKRRIRQGGAHKIPKTMNVVLTTVPTRHSKKRYDFLKWVAAAHRRRAFRATIQILEFGITPQTQNQLKLLTFHRTQLISVRWPGFRVKHNNVPRGFRHLKTFPQFKIKARRLEIEVSRKNRDQAGQKHVQRVLQTRAAIWPRTQLSLIVRGRYESRAFPISLRRTPTSPTPRVTALEYSFARYHRFQIWVSRYEKRNGRLPRALYNRLRYKFEQSQYWLNHKMEPRGRVHSLQNVTIIGTIASRFVDTIGEKTLAYPGKLQNVQLQYTYHTPGSVISVQAQKLKLHSAVVANLSRGRTGVNLTLGYKRARLRRSQTQRSSYRKKRDIPQKRSKNSKIKRKLKSKKKSMNDDDME